MSKGTSGFLVARQGLVCMFVPEWTNIEVRLGRALAGGAHPRRMELFESFLPYCAKIRRC